MQDLFIDFSDWQQRDRFIEYVKTWKGKKVVYVEHPKLLRTPDTLEYYFVVLTYISKDTGHEVMELHDIFKEFFLPTVTFDNYGDLSTANISQDDMIAYVKKVKHFYQRFSGRSIPDSKEIIRPKVKAFSAEEYAEKFESK